MHSVEWNAVIDIAVGWALTFVVGFEREVRGAPAGDRTFSLIGIATALIGTVAPHYPAVLGGAVTGIGFIGGGLCFRQAVKVEDQERDILHGVTTAASVFGAAAIGAIAGCGELIVATASTVGILLSLEFRHIPVLRYLDARRWAYLFNDDNHRHFKLRDIEQAIGRTYQEYGLPRPAHVQHERTHHEVAPSAPAGAAAPDGSPLPSGSAAHVGISLVGPIKDDSLVAEGETAAVLANQVAQSGARGNR